MSASLLDGLIGQISPDVVGKAASMLGESESAIRKGAGGAIPVLLSGLANRSDDPGFASSLFDLVRSPANDGDVLSDVGSLLGSDDSSPMAGLGSNLLGMLSGGNTANVANALAGYAGIKSSTALKLLSFLAPLVLAFLGKRARKDNLNAASLANLLRSQKSAITAAVPGPLANIGNYLGAPVKERAVYTPPVVEQRAPIWRWLLPALAAIAAIAILVPMFGRNDRAEEPAAQVATVEPAGAPATEVIAPTVAAPSGTVYFDVDQSALTANGVASLSPVIEYLRQNPGATAVVSGYHDPSGDVAANEELAKNRADAVRSSLIAAGIEESRIELQKPVVTEGGGPPEEARKVEVNASS